MKKIIIMMLAFMPLTMFAQKFGHVDTQAIMQSLPELAKVRGELEAKATEYENELKAMQEELQNKADAYDKAKATMSQTQQQEKETELQGIYQKIQQAYQDNQQAMQKLQQEKMEPIQAKVITAIKNVQEKGGYVYIMDMQALAGTVFINTKLSTDVTKDVQAEIKNIK